MTAEYSKILHRSDMLTCLYLTLLLTILHRSNYILQLGQPESLYIALALALAEVLKSTACSQVRVKNLPKTVLVFLSVFGVIYVIAVLFGAPALSHFQETAIFSLFLTVTAGLPALLHLGPQKGADIFLSLTSYEGDSLGELFLLKVRLTVFGAWLGAFVIPLDWNRKWQQWPIPCIVGGLLGYTVANLATSFLQAKQKRGRGRKTGKYTL